MILKWFSPRYWKLKKIRNLRQLLFEGMEMENEGLLKKQILSMPGVKSITGRRSYGGPHIRVNMKDGYELFAINRDIKIEDGKSFGFESAMKSALVNVYKRQRKKFLGVFHE